MAGVWFPEIPFHL